MKAGLGRAKTTAAAYVGNSLTVHNFYLSFTHRDRKPFYWLVRHGHVLLNSLYGQGQQQGSQKKIRKDFLRLHNNYTSSTMPERSDRLQIFKYLGVLSSYKITSKLTSMK